MRRPISAPAEFACLGGQQNEDEKSGCYLRSGDKLVVESMSLPSMTDPEVGWIWQISYRSKTSLALLYTVDSLDSFAWLT